MARLTRVHQKVFASNASNNGVFGSLQAGNPTTSNNVATLQSLSAFENGWDDAIERGDKLPPLEEFQGLQYGISYQQAYMLQEGIAEWNANTPYYKGSLTKTISGTSFKLYCSLADNNTNNVVTNTTYWKLVMDSDVGYADANFSNLLSPAKNISNWSDNVSNCITEIPQDIKLELNNGTLTLKSGSIITGPSGAQVQTTADRSLTVSSDGQYFVYCTMSGSGIGSYSRVLRTGSGPSLPADGTNYSYFYNTSDSKIYSWSGGAWSETSISLPLCIFTVSGGAISSIDQVFNGFGYMGTIFYVLPGVKGIAPNGRNIDGTLNGTDISITGLYVNNVSGNGTFAIRLRTGWIGFSEFIYKEDVNYNYNAYVAAGNERVEILAGYITLSGGKITDFSPKTVFHSTDYYDVAIKKEDNVFTGSNTFSSSTSFSGSATFGNAVEFNVKPITDTLSNDDRYISKWSNYAQGTAPSNNVYGGVDCLDSNGVEIASCYGSVDTSNTSRAALWVKSPVSGSSQTAQISIQCDSSGNFTTYAPTPAVSNNSTNIATTAWVNDWASANSTSALASWSNGANGYYKFKNGLIIQWGVWEGSSDPDIVFPTAFSNTNYSITANERRNQNNAYDVTFENKTTTGVRLHGQVSVGNWIAIGY